jgi:hypothetical protein
LIDEIDDVIEPDPVPGLDGGHAEGNGEMGFPPTNKLPLTVEDSLPNRRLPLPIPAIHCVGEPSR